MHKVVSILFKVIVFAAVVSSIQLYKKTLRCIDLICCGPVSVFMPLGYSRNTVCCTICARQVAVAMHHTDRCSQEYLLECQGVHLLQFPVGQVLRQQSFIHQHVG